MHISKIVIPAAGFGTRFLPLTKSVPKELLPLVNKPALQEVIEEGIASNIHDFYLVINEDKAAIQHYFNPNVSLKTKLHQHSSLAATNNLITQATFHYVHQPEMRGLGHAILMAKQAINNEFFGVILPDDLIFHSTPGIKQLINIAQEHNATVVAVMEVPGEEISSYGSIKPGNYITNDIIEILDIIEKPTPDKAFSQLGIIGRYIFTPAIFDAIEAITPHARGEIQLTDAIVHLAKKGHRVLAYKIKGQRFDIGRPAGWLAANINLGMQSAEFGPQVRKIISDAFKLIS
jgi:UTP--glucose-1-phosphate uridylyltransferase